MREFAVDTDPLQMQINQMNEELDSALRALLNLTASVEALKPMWDGEAHQAFEQEYEKDREIVQNLCDQARIIIDYFQAAKKDYDKCESDVESVVSSISV